jgi:Zn/Cd-binding protein ZinT
MIEQKQKTISYSQFSVYAKCPQKWKHDYLGNLRVYEQTVHTIFGTAFHNTLQNYLTVMYNQSVKNADAIDLNNYLQEQMFSEYKVAVEKNGGVHFSDPKELSSFLQDGIEILKYIKRHRGVYFPSKNHKLVGIEVPLNLQLKEGVDFIGYIDVVIRDERTGRIKVWDIKTSTSGWNKYQKADITKTAQLILYKEFYAKQFGVDVDMIDVEYLIVRRKINENAEFVPKRVQTFIPASGKVTRNKVSKMLGEFIENCFTPEGDYNENGHFPAYESSFCKFCPYVNDEGLCSKKNRIKQ